MTEFSWTAHANKMSLTAEVHPWYLEIVKTGPGWFWEVALDRDIGPHNVARTVVAQGDATSLDEAQEQCLQVVAAQEQEWDARETPSDWRREARLAQEARDQQRQHDHTWVWNGSNYQCQCGATSDNNVEVK